jgi:hypothetical protein
MLTAVPTVARLQPNSARRGSISTAGALRVPAAPIRITNAAPNTIQWYVSGGLVREMDRPRTVRL